MYDGQCSSDYVLGIAHLSALCAQSGIDLRFYFLNHEALITKARNLIADEFLRSGDDALLFIDADIGFHARDALHLLALLSSGQDHDVVAAPYPLKQIAWANALKAAKAGLADSDPGLLALYASPIAVHPAEGSSFPVDRPLEVTKAGTGFMMIRRETFDRYRHHYPDRRHGPGSMSGASSDAPAIATFFETELDTKQGNIAEEIRAFLTRFPDAKPADLLSFLDSDQAMHAYSGRHISEDYAFCRRVRAAGMKVWLCPWMELTHKGDHLFTSRLIELSAIGAA
jgi:hypothetical protein